MAAAAGPLTYLLLLLSHLPPSSTAQDRRFSESKRCADPECSKLMHRGKAIQDFTGPDCRFLNFKKDELIYVYHKLDGRSSDLWAGSVDSFFGYFPKNLIDVKADYVTEELVFPTDQTDFVCFDDGRDNFDSYNVDELLNKQKGSTTGKSQPGDESHPQSETEAKESELSQSAAAPGETPPSQSETGPGESLPTNSETAPRESPHSDPKTSEGESSPTDLEAAPTEFPLSDPKTSEGKSSTDTEAAPRESSLSDPEKAPRESPLSDPKTSEGESPPSYPEKALRESPLLDPKTSEEESPPSDPKTAEGESPPSGVLPPSESVKSPGEPRLSESKTFPEELRASELTAPPVEPSPDSEEPPPSESSTTPEHSYPELVTPPGEPRVLESRTSTEELSTSESGTSTGESGKPPDKSLPFQSGPPTDELSLSESEPEATLVEPPSQEVQEKKEQQHQGLEKEALINEKSHEKQHSNNLGNQVDVGKTVKSFQSVTTQSKNSQEDHVAHDAIDQKSKVPESEQPRNGSTSDGGTNPYKEKMENLDSFTLIDEELIQNLKTKIDSTGDAVVSDDEETIHVTLEDKFRDEYEDTVDDSYDAQYEEDLIEEFTEAPLLSYDESDEKSLDHTTFENHSMSSTPSEAKATPPEDEVEVPVDMGHATTLKPEQDIITTWGDTFFAIVSGGETTREVTHPDGTDSEEEEEEEEDTIEQLEEDNSLYLLGMDKNSMRQHDHSEDSLDDDLYLLEEDPLDETLTVVEVDKSSQTEPNITITTNSSSSGETFSPKSETGAELSTDEQDVMEHPGKMDVESASLNEPRDTVNGEAAKEGSQLPPDDKNATTEEFTKSLKDSELPGTKLNENIETREDNRDGATSENPSVELKENKETETVDIKIEADEDLEQDHSINKEVRSSADSGVEHLNTNQGKTGEIESVETKLASLDLAVPDDDKPTIDSVPADLPSEVDNTPQQSPVVEAKDIVSPGLEETESSDRTVVEDIKSVDESKSETSSTEEDDNLKEKLGEIETKKEEDEQDDHILKEKLGEIETKKEEDEQDDNILKEKLGEIETKKEEDEQDDNILKEKLGEIETKKEEDEQDDNILKEKLGEIETKKEEDEQLKLDNHEAGQQPEDTKEPDTEVRADIEVSEVEVHLSNEDDEEEPPLGVDREETDVDNRDELLEDENAVSARRSRELLSKAESDSDLTDDLPKSVSGENEPTQETALKILEPENEETTVQEADPSVPEDVVDEKVDVVTEPKKENIPTANEEETEKVDDRLSQNKIDSNISGTENQQKGATIVQEDVEKATKEYMRDDISDPSNDKSANVEEPDESQITGIEALEEASYIESIRALTIMRDYLDEVQISQFTNILGSDNIFRLEAMFQDMDSELKLARRENVRLDYIDKALDEILEASDSTILGFVESVLDALEVNSESTATEKEMFDDLLDDVQEISYKLRQKHSTLGDSSLLAPGVPDTEIKEEERPRTGEWNSKADELDPEQARKEEVPTVPEPQTEEIAEPPPALQEAELEEVYATEEPLASPTHGPDGAMAKDEEEPGAVVANEGESEMGEPESQPLTVSQVLSSMGGAVLAAEKSFTPVARLVMLALPEDLQPGPDFYGVQWNAVIFTLLVGFLSVLVFFWRTCLSVKSRVYQVNEKQLAEKIAALMKEKSEALEKISEFEKKIKEVKESENTTQEKSTHLQEEAAALKVTIKELKNSNKQLDGKMWNLLQELDSQKEQNKRKQEMIYEGQKSIEQLKEQFEQHSEELSELQIALNEAKLKEHKVRSNLHSVQEENARLKERKEQLLQEADGWSERQRELDERIQLQQKSHKDLEEALAYKENEIEVLTNCIMQLKQLEEDSGAGEDGNWQLAGSGELENGELPDKRKEKMKMQIKQMMDVSRVKTTLSIIEEEKDLYQRKLTDEISARHELEEQIKLLEHDNSFLQSDKTCLDNECKTLRQKLEIVTELYQQKEMALQKKLTQEEYERQEKEQKLSAADEKAVSASEEVKIYKQRFHEMDEELQKTERSFKNQIASHEKKAHENWLIARTAERTLAEEKRECANLRQKLIEVNQRIAALQRPSIVKPTPGRPEHQPPPRRAALSRDGSFGPSPVSGGAPSPPMMMDVSVRSASANLSRSEDSKGGIDVASGSRRPPPEMSGRTSAPVDLGHSTTMVNAGPRTSSPSMAVDGLVMPIAKGPPLFPGTPVMNSPAAAPMMPPPRFIGPHPPRGSFGSRSLPPPQMHGPPPGVRDFPPRPLLPPGSMPASDPRSHIRGPLPPRDFPPGPVPLHGPRDYPILPPPGVRDFPPGLPPPGSRDFPPGPPLPSARDFLPGPPHPGARDFPPRDFPQGSTHPGMRDFPPGPTPPGMRDFPPGPTPPGMRDFPPGHLPPGVRDIPPGLPPPREYIPGLPPPGSRDFPSGLPPGSREFMPRPLPPGGRDFPPGPPLAGIRDFPQRPHPGVPAGPSLPHHQAFPPPHNQPTQTDHEHSQGQKS
ncbi:transport and Golgi organization protein 1 homolog isoform X2 [Pseudophryne corroboree]|uniref:transport and Golgi organization protein 1 homolog isoform X2 n=1 Tax=Pseudophryne corroboree TaxID=495146 RepID=UPI003081A563